MKSTGAGGRGWRDGGGGVWITGEEKMCSGVVLIVVLEERGGNSVARKGADDKPNRLSWESHTRIIPVV